MDDASVATPPGAGASERESEGEDDTMPVIKRRKLNVSGSDGQQSASRSVSPSEQTKPVSHPAPPSRPSFSDKLIEVYHDAVQSSATPSYLQNRFMVSIVHCMLHIDQFDQVYNMVGAVRCHNESDSTSLVEVEFHSSITHHSFSVSNHSNFSMAALSSSALVLASEKNYDEPRYPLAIINDFRLTGINKYFSSIHYHYTIVIFMIKQGIGHCCCACS